MNPYKDFIRHKISWSTVVNLAKKVNSLEDFLYAFGLLWFAVTKIVFKRDITNETVRGR